jgi:nitrate/nitrite transport system substrate-binding protein
VAQTSGTFGSLETGAVRLGVIPLTDCAPLAIAQEKGLFRKWGLDVSLSREASWANIRDKVSIGALDGGHMLGALPLAATLGLGGITRPMITAFSLNLNGSAITVSQDLWTQMLHADPSACIERPLTARALRRVVEQRRSMGAPPLDFAVVFPFSAHNYLLRYWLAEAGIDPDNDVRLTVVPPPLMVAKLAARHIDGFCVGAPWNQRAVDLRVGRVALSSYELWNLHPDKVFGVARDWAERHPNTHNALLAALIEACQWLDDPQHRLEASAILATRRYVDVPEEIVAMSMIGTMKYGADDPPRLYPDFHIFSRHDANFPWLSHAEWTLTQMRRWGQIGGDVDIPATAAAVYRPDIYRAVATALGLPAPTIDRKIETAFFDGRLFNPTDLTAYSAQFRTSIDAAEGSAAQRRRNA